MTDGIVAAVSLAALVLLAILLQPDGSDADDLLSVDGEDQTTASTVFQNPTTTEDTSNLEPDQDPGDAEVAVPDAGAAADDAAETPNPQPGQDLDDAEVVVPDAGAAADDAATNAEEDTPNPQPGQDLDDAEVVVPDAGAAADDAAIEADLPPCLGEGEIELAPGEGCQYTVIGSIEEGSIEVEPNSSLLDVEASADTTGLIVRASPEAMPEANFTVSYQLAGESMNLGITIADRP